MQTIENKSGQVQDFLSNECRLLDRYELQTDLVETLSDTRGHRGLAPRVEACHRSFRHWRCENSHDWAEAENSCCVRVCPHCSRRRSLILAGRIQKHIIGRSGLRYMVLSERNCTDLAAGIASLWAAWTKLRRTSHWAEKVKGCIVALEVTRNPKDGSWHPHLNVLMEGEYYFPFLLLNRLWLRCTRGNGTTSYIKAANGGTVRELIKYVTKIADLLGNADALDEFLFALTRKRTVRTYGSFYGINVDDEENPGVECPDCGSHTSVKLGHVHPSQVSFDFEKETFRVARSPGRVLRDLETAESFEPGLFYLYAENRHKKGDWREACEDHRWKNSELDYALFLTRGQQGSDVVANDNRGLNLFQITE